MKKIFWYFSTTLILNWLLINNLIASDSIILSQDMTQSKINKDLKLCEKFIKSKPHLKELRDKKMFSVSTETVYSKHIIKIDNILTPEVAIELYLELKNIFPNAFILQDKIINNRYKTTENRNTKVNTDEQLLWFAIFSLAIVGILALFSSSVQIKKILIRHQLMQDKQKKIEGFLANIGENIYSLSKKNIGYKGGSSKETEKSSAKGIIEKKLFSTTRVMIHFLRIKAKRIKIIKEEFNLNNVLNGVLGLLSHRFEGSNIELIFEIDNDIPKKIIGDPLHLSEVLTEVLQNALEYTENGEVKLHISLNSRNSLKFTIIDTGIGITDRQLETLFIPTYTSNDEYKGLGLFVAKELSLLMGGELKIIKSDENGTIFDCTIPFTLVENSRDDYKLPENISKNKKILIYEHNESSAFAIKKMFEYFNFKVDIVSPQKFNSNNINLASYDILLVDINKLDKSHIANIRDIRKQNDLKIVHLSNVFSTKRFIAHDYIDDWIEKPINQERIYELLISLFNDDDTSIDNLLPKKLKVITPDNLVEMDNISTNNFINFKGRNILIVEDNIIDQKVMYSILTKVGINITIANHGEEALEYLDANNKYDLILMDISMPIMDGYETITKIRNQSKFDNIPIISLTSLALDNDINKIFRVGSNGYLRKPLKIGYLYSTLKEFLIEDSTASPSPKKLKPKAKKYSGIDGLDVEKGIKHSNGSEELYKEVLDEFVSAYESSGDSLALWVSESRYEHVKRLCLDMKGLTSTIGAYKMFELVDTMHKQFLYNNVHLIPKFVDSYKKELNDLLDTIRKYMEEE